MQSEIYDVYDCLWYDIASSSTHKSDYTKYPNNDIPISYENDCTVLSETTGTEYRYGVNYTLPSDCTVEFDLNVSSNSVNNPYLYLKGWQPYLSSQVFNRDVWVNVKFILSNGNGKCFVEGVETPVTSSYNTGNGNLQLRYNNATLRFKNFKIYPI